MAKERIPATRSDSHRLRIRRLEWGPFVAIALLHVVCLAAPFTFTWGAVAVAFILYWAVGCLGVTLCYHRLLTHRSFETPKIFEYLFTVLGTLAWQGGPVRWVGTHRLHHKEADTHHDPHSPRHGFSWGHVFWAVTRDPFGRDVRNWAPDLRRDPVMMWLDRWFWVPQVTLGVALWAVGGWPWVVWGIAVRTVLTYHATWFVNSASHTWGYRTYEVADDSTNNWWVALLSWGEGWHNNHHAYQRSARHGMRWYEVDVTWWVIRAMSWIGLARNLVLPARPRAG
jgi:stearoyl-CoA desaturase (delta-9 desaturase)